MTPLAGSPFKGCGTPEAVTIDPSGRFAYVAINKTGVCAFTVDPTSGALTKVKGSPFGGGSSPNHLTVDARNKYLYASDGAANVIEAYAIDPCSGALTVVPGSPFATGTSPGGIAVWGSH